MSTDHVVMRGNDFVCLHCGQRYRPTLPAPINVMVAMSRAFGRAHRDCQPKTGEPMMKRFEPGGPL